MMKTFVVIIMALILLTVGCISGIGQNSERGDEKDMIDESDEIAQFRLRIQEHREEYMSERDKINVDYVIRGDYNPANKNIELLRIERFVFSNSINAGGYGFVLDKMHSRVYYDPNSAMVERLSANKFSAEFKEEDLNRLIRVIEESGMLDWEKFYESEDDGTMASSAWVIGILFDDGTMFRTAGQGRAKPGGPPDEQFNVLLDFIRAFGKEIEIRHNNEQTETP